MENGNNLPLPSGFGTRPWLIQQTCGGSCKDAQTTLVDMPDRSLHAVTIPEMQGKICLGCVYDGTWLLLLDEATHDCFLLNVVSRRPKISLPPLCPTKEYKGATCGVVGSPANFTVVIASDREAEQMFLLCSRPGDEEWTDLTAEDDGCGVRFSGSIVSHAGKLYAGELVVMDVDDGEIRSQDLSTDTEDHDRAMFGPTVRYLVVSHGDLFDVLIKYRGRPYDGSFIMMAVRRLDLSDLVWRRVESIGSDRVFLLSGDYGFSCSAASAQLQGNCVYLVWSSCDCERLYRFCLDDMTKSFHQILPKPTAPSCRTYWVVPNDIQASEFKGQALLSGPTSSEVTLLPNDFNNHPEEQQKSISLPPWQDLRLELLELIASNLSLVDRIRFPAICKPWSMVTNPIEQAHVWPWLMHISKQDGKCKMLDPLRGEQYVLQVEAFKTEIDHHVFRSSKDGWVVASAGPSDDEIFIINPFTQDIVETSLHVEFYRFRGITFSSAPSSPDSVVFGITSSTNGKYLGEDLVSVFMRNADEPPRVFKLDKMNMAWAQVEDIGGAALFVDYRASFGLLSPGAGNGNRIYFPRYSEDGKHAAFYDMETKAYHPTFYGVKEPMNCVWVVPNLQEDA
nr:unnamed protein product [Digitaria exilis]